MRDHRTPSYAGLVVHKRAQPVQTGCSRVRLSWSDDTGRREAGALAELDLLRQAVALRPHQARYHYALAEAHFRAEAFEAGLEAFDKAVACEPAQPRQLAPYLRALCAVGRADEALTLIGSRFPRLDSHPDLLACRGAAHLKRGELERAVADLRGSLQQAPRSALTLSLLTKALSQQRDWQGLVDVAEGLRGAGVLSNTVVRALIQGLTHLGRVEEAASWVAFEDVVRVRDLTPPSDWPSLEAFNAALVADVRSPHKIRLRDVPRLRLTGGEQVEDLHVDSSPAMGALMCQIREAVQDYVDQAASPVRALLDAQRGEVMAVRAWALLLGESDTQDDHFHLESMLAGVYYVDAPAQVLVEGCTDGCLLIPTETAVAGGPRAIQPRPGRLVLFPGYVNHRTTPTNADATRVSIAFNVVAVA